ncbi:hypothetical protein [Marinobacter salsuginis]|uniref:hypothetical protein n=1 Tax=Marinobacter salsuginis TaxID=418719 RepID=UPI00273FFAF0|nr:hypothetical protein [Marinobacter salsuginis]
MQITPDSLSCTRLDSKSVPHDMAVLLERYQAKLSARGFFISDDPNVTPWADESYLTAEDLANPDIAANVRAMRDTNELIYFIGHTDNGESFGIWRKDMPDDLNGCPPVTLDTEGQYEVYSSWAECLRMLLCDDPICDEIEKNTGKFPKPSIVPNDYRNERYELYLSQNDSGT